MRCTAKGSRGRLVANYLRDNVWIFSMHHQKSTTLNQQHTKTRPADLVDYRGKFLV